MRLTSSACTGASTGTSSSSVRVRLKSGSCSMITSLASVNRRLQKVIVNLSGRRLTHQRDEIQKRFSAQMRLSLHLDIRGVRGKHPDRNFQPPACWIYDRDCTVLPFRSPADSQAITVQRMKRIENVDVRGLRTQGTVGDCCIIRTCTAWSPPAASRPTTRAGSAQDARAT